jgi:hypothetical protein
MARILRQHTNALAHKCTKPCCACRHCPETRKLPSSPPCPPSHTFLQAAQDFRGSRAVSPLGVTALGVMACCNYTRYDSGFRIPRSTTRYKLTRIPRIAQTRDPIGSFTHTWSHLWLGLGAFGSRRGQRLDIHTQTSPLANLDPTTTAASSSAHRCSSSAICLLRCCLPRSLWHRLCLLVLLA